MSIPFSFPFFRYTIHFAHPLMFIFCVLLAKFFFNSTLRLCENIGSVYRSSNTHDIKFIVSWITFVYAWLRFERIFSRHRLCFGLKFSRIKLSSLRHTYKSQWTYFLHFKPCWKCFFKIPDVQYKHLKEIFLQMFLH